MLDDTAANEVATFLTDIEEQAVDLASDVFKLASAGRSKELQRDESVREKILQEWAQGWEYYDAVLYSARQMALVLAERSDRTRAEFVKDEHDASRSALCLIHFAGCQTLDEVRTLLLSGLWAGAAARWRGLHELAITARLVAMGGPNIAQRYLDHGHVVQTRRLIEYYEKHGRGPVGKAELQSRQEQSEALIAHHTLPNQSRPFRDAYGWATPLLPLTKKGQHAAPTFDQLEALAGYGDLRLLVYSAHGLVHNDSGGVAASVLGDFNGSSYEWIAVPTELHTETVARPALVSAQILLGATILGSEPQWSELARSLASHHVAIQRLASWGADAFSRRRRGDLT